MKLIRLSLLVLCMVFIIRCGDNNNPTSSQKAPTIASITPNSLSRGARVVTTQVRGTNLTNVSAVSFGPDIIVHGWRLISTTQTDVDVSIGRTAAPGARSISLTADGGSATSSAIFTVLTNTTPVAEFSINPPDGSQNDIFQFDASGSTDDGSIQQYLWEFSDGSPNAKGKTVSRQFAAGSYHIKLTLTDNNGATSSKIRDLNVQQFTPVVCPTGSKDRGLLYGTVIAVEPGNIAIVRLDKENSTCENSFYKCGDMRDGQVDLDFYGIISEMTDLGGHTFRVKNDCPFKWPPKIGRRVFLFWKSCANVCP